MKTFFAILLLSILCWCYAADASSERESSSQTDSFDQTIDSQFVTSRGFAIGSFQVLPLPIQIGHPRRKERDVYRFSLVARRYV